MSSSLNIRDLQREVANRQHRKIAIYEDILKLIHKKILTTNAASDICCCTYTIPVYLYGYPLYNHSKCIEYIIASLLRDKFEVRMMSPMKLFISWKPRQPPPPSIPTPPSYMPFIL
jgi:uncharacterized LabA/DUF88 family protein